MSYSTSFHPISISELQRFLFDIVDEPNLADVRAAELGSSEEEINKIKTIYQIVIGDYDDIKANPHKFNSSFSFAAAAIAGYLHPYFYAGEYNISKICTEEFRFSGIERSIDSLTEFESKATLCKNRYLPFSMFANSGRFTEVLQTGTKIRDEFQGSGYLPSYKVKEQLYDLHRLYALDSVIPKTADFWDAAFNAFRYADKNDLGIIEATNIYTPSENEFFSRESNLQSKANGAKLKPAVLLSDAYSVYTSKEIDLDHFYDDIHSLDISTFLEDLRHYDVNPNQSDSDGCNSFHMLSTATDDVVDLDELNAIIRNSKALETWLYKQRLSRMFIMLYNYYDSYSEINNLNFYGNSPLHLAVKNNNPLMIVTLCYFGANINLTDYDGNTPLHTAIELANEEIVELLLKLNADKSIPNHEGQDAFAIYKERLAQFRAMGEMLESGVEVF